MTCMVIGIDVQAARHCPFAVLGDGSRIVDAGWIAPERLVGKVRELAARHAGAAFAIDAPRMALPAKRVWYWRNGHWQRGTGAEKGRGRHCEVVVAAHRLANPQWTPLAAHAPEWMRHGFAIFDALAGWGQTLEVFPSASYRMLNEARELRINLPLAGFLPGPKDMLDAVVAALTGMEFLAGRGMEVGGGDGFGTIVLPRPIAEPIPGVLQWPEER